MDLHADVLKVGHHGSAYRSTPAFIARNRSIGDGAACLF
jgi:beta-lactamase superfamily II metal-dependent hydrolase